MEKSEDVPEKKGKARQMADEKLQGVVTHVRTKKKGILIGFIFIIIVALGAGLAYSQYELYKIKNPAYQQKLVQQQTDKIIKTVGVLIQLPEGTPQIATVADVDALKKTQAFFTNAKNGDQVLVYTTEAILYRPSENKIINVGPVSREPDQAAQQQTSTGTPEVVPAGSAPIIKTNPIKK